MNEMVFLSPNTAEPFTTSDVVASFTQTSYRSVQRLIERQIERLERFGRVRFEITPFQTKGGMQSKKIYSLNEAQATLLIAFLKNTDVVADFKVELVRQFFAMRAELQRVSIAKGERRIVRENLTDTIKALPDSPHKTMKYKQYTDLAYMLVLGQTAKKIREMRGAPKHATASNYMTAAEIEAVTAMENRICVLVSVGMPYTQVKAALSRTYLVSA